MRYENHRTLQVAFALVLVGCLVAGTQALAIDLPTGKVDQKAKFAKDGSITIETLAGSIEIIGWDKNEIQVTGTVEEKAKKFVFDVGKKKARLKVESPDNTKGNVKGSNLIIHLPRRCKVDVSSVSADITVDKVTGRLYPQTVSGDVKVSGTLDEIEVETVSGEIDLDVESGSVRANSVSGDLALNGVKGDVNAETVSGEILVRGGTFKRFDANSVSGDVEFHGALNGDGTFRFNSHSGDIVLYLPANTSADFEINTFSGDIDNAFGPEAERTSEYVPGKELEFTTGNGDARVRIHTISGDVELLKT